MERREKIQGFIKKYIILKKRKPTDSIFAEKRSAVAIAFALMLPIFFGMFAIAMNMCTMYYAEELLAMGLDGAATVLSAAGYSNAMSDSSLDRNVQIVLSDAFCQYPSLYNCWGVGVKMGPFLPNNVSHWRWVNVKPAYGGVISAKGYTTGLLTFALGSMYIGKEWSNKGITATSILRFIN